jgi:hypothetical protein
MVALSERQEKAKALTRELQALGAWVISPLPLDDHARLRVQIKDIDRNRIIQVLKDWEWDPVFVSVLPRVCTTGLVGACIYEIDLPRERQPVPQDERAVPRDEFGRRKKDPEVEATLKHLGWYK